LVSGWPEGKAPALDAESRKSLVTLMDGMPEEVRDRLLALSQRWGAQDLFGARIAEITGALRGRVADGSIKDEDRVAAAKRLIALDANPSAVETVLEEITPLSPPVLSTGFISALSESREPKTADAILEHWNQFTPATRRNATAAMLRRPEWTRALLDAVENKKLARTEIATEHWSQLKQNPNRMISRRAERLSAAGGAASSDRQEISKLLPLAKEKGDPSRGKEVYATACAVCHTFQGQGGKVGPDLTGIAARDRGDILLDILDPNRSVEANYQLWTVATRDNETYSGRLETETQTTVEILDTTGQKHVIQRKDIATMQSGGLSIMPGGFETLPAEDLKGLIAYLTAEH
jgi:putative heme-binding domain-containing protein